VANGFTEHKEHSDFIFWWVSQGKSNAGQFKKQNAHACRRF
jgi:hypothetical protein